MTDISTLKRYSANIHNENPESRNSQKRMMEILEEELSVKEHMALAIDFVGALYHRDEDAFMSFTVAFREFFRKNP